MSRQLPDSIGQSQMKTKILPTPERPVFSPVSHAKNVVLDIYNMPQPPLLYRHSVINMTQPASTASQ